MKQILLISGILIMFGNIALPEVRTLSISNVVELALQNDSRIKQMAEEVVIAQAQLNQSMADYTLPDITANAGFTLLDPLTVNDGIFSLPGFPVQFTNVFMDNYTGGITVSKTLFTGFRLWNSLRIKQINLELMNKRMEDKKKEITYNTLSSFYNLFLLKENISLSEEQEQTLSNQVRNIELNFENGTASEYDKVRVNVLFTYNQPRLLSARNSYKTAKISLCDSIGIKDYDNVEFTGNFMEYTNLTMTNLSENEAINRSFSNDINLKAMDYNIEMLKITRDINDSAKYPTLSAYFNLKDDYKKENMTNTDRSWVPSWTAGLQLSFPVDDWLPISKTANTVSESDANIRKNMEARRQMADSLALQVKSLLMQLEVSRINISSQLSGLNQAKLGLELANKRYDAGAGLASEIIDSEFSFTQAQTSYLQAVFDYCSSVLKLKRLIGE
jgi:outer membrane protein